MRNHVSLLLIILITQTGCRFNRGNTTMPSGQRNVVDGIDVQRILPSSKKPLNEDGTFKINGSSSKTANLGDEARRNNEKSPSD